MTQPTFVGEFETAWDITANGSRTSGSIAVNAGDKLVVMAASEATDLRYEITGISDTAGNVWTLSDGETTIGYCDLACWKATATSTTSITVTVTRGNNTGDGGFGFSVLQFRDSDGFGASAIGRNTTGTPTLGLTTTQDDSTICTIFGDFDAQDHTRTWATINSSAGTEQTWAYVPGRYTSGLNRWANAGTLGSKTTGFASLSPASAKWNLISIEVKGIIPPTTDPQIVGVGAQVVSTTSGGTLSPAYPTGYTAVANDYCFLIAAGKHNNGSSLTPNNPTNYGSPLGTRFRELGTYDLQITVWAKKLTASEAAPTLTVPAAYSTTSGGLSAQLLIARNLDITTLLDGSVIASDGAAPTTPFDITPTGLTTSIAKALVLSCIATADDNALSLQTAQSFTVRMSGASYDTSTGGDHAVGVATRLVDSPGAVTMPTWRETLVGGDAWVHLAISVRPVDTGSFTSKLKLGDTVINAAKFGDTAVARMYLGDIRLL